MLVWQSRAMNHLRLAQPLTLPNGTVLKNRIGKAPLTEGLADPMNRATERHVRLYGRWAAGGWGKAAPCSMVRANSAVSGRGSTPSSRRKISRQRW